MASVKKNVLFEIGRFLGNNPGMHTASSIATALECSEKYVETAIAKNQWLFHTMKVGKDIPNTWEEIERQYESPRNSYTIHCRIDDEKSFGVVAEQVLPAIHKSWDDVPEFIEMPWVDNGSDLHNLVRKEIDIMKAGMQKIYSEVKK